MVFGMYSGLILLVISTPSAQHHRPQSGNSKEVFQIDPVARQAAGRTRSIPTTRHSEGTRQQDAEPARLAAAGRRSGPEKPAPSPARRRRKGGATPGLGRRSFRTSH